MNWTFDAGLQEIGKGVYAYMQPDGGFGLSNAGLICDGDQSLLVDTLYDEVSTAKMLSAMRSADKAANNIGVIVNTHANGDHTYGNSLVPEARVLASRAAIEEMALINPARSFEWMSTLAADPVDGAYFQKVLDNFRLQDITYRPADEGFVDKKTMHVGDKRVDLIEVGPCHTQGDILAYVPSDRTVYTGDVLFVDCTPVMWAGPIENWQKACNRILEMDVETIVPGHGPITDKNGVRRVQAYLHHIDREARARYDAGLSLEDAIADIPLGEYEAWGEAERIVLNMSALYREYGYTQFPDLVELFLWMARYARKKNVSPG